MKTNLSFLQGWFVRLRHKLILLPLLFSLMMVGQTTIVSYSFTGDLSANPVPVPPANTTLTYNYSNGSPRTPAYDSNWLKAVGAGDYLELSVDASGFSNLVLSFDGRFSTAFGIGTWNVFTNTGAGNSFQNIGGLTIFSALGLTNNDSVIIALPAGANNKPDLKIRVQVYLGWELSDNLRIDNLKLSYGSPKIHVSTAGNIPIPHLSPASVALTTDFGTRQTSAPPLARNFRVRNYQGTPGSVLYVSGFTVTGANPGDFIVTPASLSPLGVATNSSGNPSQQFTVRFKPLADGIRTAEINLYSNAAPSPYRFTLMGVGASCSLETTAYVSNNFTLTGQTLESNCATTDIAAGVSNPAGSNSLGSVLYPNGQNLFTSSSSSLVFRGLTEKMIDFCGPAGVNVAQKKDVAIAFNVAAFTTTNKPFNFFTNLLTIDDTENGLNLNSTVTVSVLMPNNTWSDQFVLRGSDDSGLYYRNGFLSGTQADATLGLGSIFSNTNSNSYKRVVLRIPASAGITNLKFRIKGKTENSNKIWLVDDVSILSNNAVFKTWKTIGANTAWYSSANVAMPVPTLDEKVFIDTNYTLAQPSITACECEINPGKTLNIATDKFLQLRGALINNGIFNIESDGHLLQIEDEAHNVGTISLKRNLTFRNNERKEYNYLISPVEDANLKTDIYKTSSQAPVIAPEVLYYNESNFRFYSSTGAYIKGRALAVKEPPVSSGAVQTAFFSGKPFNGILNYPLAYSGASFGYNLVGNPYPSNLDLDILYDDNQSEIESTFLFWDNTVNEIYVQQGSAYDGSAYAIYNAAAGTGGTGLPSPGTGQAAVGSSKIPNRIAKTGQGFMVRTLGAGRVLQYGNHQRLADNAGAVLFGKNTPDDRYYLNLNSPNGITSAMAVVYFEGGNNEVAADDSEARGCSDEIFSVAGDAKLIIDGRSAFSDTDVIGLGTRGFTGGSYSISLSRTEGVFAAGQNIYLKDRLTGTITNLSSGSYSFDAGSGEHTGRFEIIYKPETVLATDQMIKDDIRVYRDGGDFVVKAQNANITGLEVYDGVGRMVWSSRPNSLTVQLSGGHLLNGVYIMKISQSGKVTSKKIIK